MSLNHHHNHNDDDVPNRPNASTYWVIPGRFLAGEYPAVVHGDEQASRVKLRRYLQVSGITYILDLTRPGECTDYHTWLWQEAAALHQSVTIERFSIPDYDIPSSPAVMMEILNRLDAILSNNANNRVYVHCRGGIGRTGTVVGCFLARQFWNHHQQQHQPSNPSSTTMLQELGIRAWHETNRLFQVAAQSRAATGQPIQSPETIPQQRYVVNWPVYEQEQEQQRAPQSS